MLRNTILVLSILVGGSAFAADAAIGDSIAYGVSGYLPVTPYAKVGASSCAIVRFMPKQHYDRVVISAGINDPPGPCVLQIRQNLKNTKVVWILPCTTSARANVANIARKFGDFTVSYIPGHDGIHPRSYPELAAAVTQTWNLH